MVAHDYNPSFQEAEASLDYIKSVMSPWATKFGPASKKCNNNKWWGNIKT